jgi:hypothetical protein
MLCAALSIADCRPDPKRHDVRAFDRREGRASGGERVQPPQTRKSRKVAIDRAQRQSMLDRQRRQMRIRDQLGAYSGQDEKAAEMR